MEIINKTFYYYNIETKFFMHDLTMQIPKKAKNISLAETNYTEISLPEKNKDEWYKYYFDLKQNIWIKQEETETVEETDSIDIEAVENTIGDEIEILEEDEKK